MDFKNGCSKCIICEREFTTLEGKILHYIESHMDLKVKGGLS